MVRQALALLLCGLGISVAGTHSSCAAEMAGPPICAGQHDCAKGQRCVLGRCRSQRALPASARGSRLLFTPTDLAALCSANCRGPSETLETIRLGAGADSHDLVLLRFAVRLPPKARVQTAVLVFDPVPSCTRRPGELTVEIAHVLAPWNSRTVRWNRQPKLGLPMHAATVPVVPPRPLRLDVTGLVDQWSEHHTRLHGLALLATGRGPGSACYSTGLTSGQEPRLEIYLAPKPKKKGADAGDADAGEADAGDGGRDRDASDAAATEPGED